MFLSQFALKTNDVESSGLLKNKIGESVLCVSRKSYFGEVDNRPQIMRMQLLLFCTEKVKYFHF